MTQQKKKQGQQKPRGQQAAAIAIDEAPYIQAIKPEKFTGEIEVGQTVQVMNEDGTTTEGKVVESEEGVIEVISATGEVLASSEFTPEEEEVEEEELVLHPVIEQLHKYHELMGPHRAPNAQEQQAGLGIAEGIFETVFNAANGLEMAQDVLVDAINFVREHKGTFRADRVLRGMFAAYPGNIQRQREIQAYATIMQQLAEKGAGARFQSGNLVIMLGNKRVEVLRVVLGKMNVRIA